MADPADTAVNENRRLRKEVKELHARIAALESSRWWRLHPRFAFARLRSRVAHGDAKTGTMPAVRADDAKSEHADPLTVSFREEVVARGRFSEDWFTMHIPSWDAVLAELAGRSSRILELGSFEGLSACFALWRLPDAHVTCVDTFKGIPAYGAYGIATELEAVFDENVALVDSSRVRKLVGETHRVLPELVGAGEQFDLVYVDASHRAIDVLVDAGLTWQLVAPRGIVIFDDYGPIPAGEEPMEHPTPAIDAFLGLVAGQLEIVERRGQLIVRKTA